MPIKKEVYPMHEKMKDIINSGERDTVQWFLAFLSENDYRICSHHSDDEFEGFLPISRSPQELMADYFEIDLGVLEAEKRNMLKRQQELNRTTYGDG